MAVLQMQLICICALKKYRKEILELLQRRGVIEINDKIPEDSIFRKSDVSVAETHLAKNISSAKEALQILSVYVPEKKSMLSVLNGRNEISVEIYNEFLSKHDLVMHTINHMIALSKEIAENKAEILRLQTQAETLFSWDLLDIPMNYTGTKHTASFIGTLPNTWSLDEIYEKLANQTPLNVDIISSSREQTCIFILCLKEKSDGVSEILRELGFINPASSIDKAPAEQLKEIDNEIAAAMLSITQAEEEIKSYEKFREDINFLYDYDTMRIEKYEVIGHLVQSNNVFVMTGYIPKQDSQAISEELNAKYEIAVEIEEPSDNEEVPILLKNNGFSTPLEGTVNAFSPPGKGEVDPTMIMSLFYYMLFGLMLSDAGYGLIMVIGCVFALIKFKSTIEDSMRNTLKMFLYCGISTVFWGVMFGSYFGDIVDVVSATYFGNKITIQPLWFFPVNEPMRMLTFAMVIGIFHLFAGLGMKIYQCLKQKDYKTILYDVVFWLLLLTSSIILLMSTQMMKDILGVNISIPSEVARVASILAILAAIGIIFTNGRESKNPFKRFLKGLYALYGISGYLSDVLSYSRLLALGLATGVIGVVINKMAGMAGGGFIGPIIFSVIFIFGHMLNLGINALGAYVHTNRLQYVEFFGKFYQGGGRTFNPFSIKTKYYKIKEKE